MDRDEELSRLYKNPFYHTQRHLPPVLSPEDPQQMNDTDKEYYWKSLLKEPLCRRQK